MRPHNLLFRRLTAIEQPNQATLSAVANSKLMELDFYVLNRLTEITFEAHNANRHRFVNALEKQLNFHNFHLGKPVAFLDAVKAQATAYPDYAAGMVAPSPESWMVDWERGDKLHFIVPDYKTDPAALETLGRRLIDRAAAQIERDKDRFEQLLPEHTSRSFAVDHAHVHDVWHDCLTPETRRLLDLILLEDSIGAAKSQLRNEYPEISRAHVNQMVDDLETKIEKHSSTETIFESEIRECLTALQNEVLDVWKAFDRIEGIAEISRRYPDIEDPTKLWDGTLDKVQALGGLSTFA
jgi:signal transduction histidine kinase